MSYDITDYSFKQAAKLGVDIKPSTKKNKKIDVIRENKVIASIGDKRYSDFPTYMKEKGLAFAKERRKLYKARHAKDLGKKDTAGYFANKILW
jgi:hypothetical protein